MDYREEYAGCTQSDWHRNDGVGGEIINKLSDLYSVSEVNWRLFLTSPFILES